LSYFHAFFRDDGTEAIVEYNVTSWGSAPAAATFTYEGDDGDPIEVEIDKVFGPDHATVITLTDAESQRAEREIYEDLPEPPFDDLDYAF
jgi:hypothetical protein